MEMEKRNKKKPTAINYTFSLVAAAGAKENPGGTFAV